MVVRCPTCGKSFESEGAPAMPFCSPRCKQIDLARWIDERIGIPVKPRPSEDEDSELPEGWGDAEEN